MPLDARSIAVSLAVIGFFSVGAVTWSAGASPFTCCQRGLIAALCLYAASVLLVKAVNAIVISAMVDTQMHQQKERPREHKD